MYSPVAAETETEAQSISLSTGPCCVSSWKAQVSFFLTNFSWYVVYVVLFLAETWSARFRRFIFQLCQFCSCCSFGLESHFPKDLWTNFRFRKLGSLKKIAPPTNFFQFLCFPLLDSHLPRRTRESWLFLSHLCNIDNTVNKTLAGLHCISSPRECLLSVHPVLCWQLQARDLTGL